jgi:hypothetical protein
MASKTVSEKMRVRSEVREAQSLIDKATIAEFEAKEKKAMAKEKYANAKAKLKKL